MNEIRSFALPIFVREALPTSVLIDIERTSRRSVGACEEIRLRSGKKCEYVFSGTSLLGDITVTQDEMQEILFRLCGGSVYAHEERICSGYIRAENGIRIGVCGRAVVRGGRVTAVRDVSSLNIRLPCVLLPNVRGLADKLFSTFGGTLIFSPPGIGKTTYLRALTRELSGRLGKRVALIDSGGELGSGLTDESLRLDVLDGYPRGVGIEIAVRVLNPDYIVCDEIGTREEAKAILGARNSGVPIIASAHGDDAWGLIMREGIRELHEAGIFRNYVRLTRIGKNCEYTLINRKDIGHGNVC